MPFIKLDHAMSASPHYSKVLLKLSGNAFAAKSGTGFCEDALRYIAAEIAEVHHTGIQMAAVLGAGNILRGASFSPEGKTRLQADSAGMVATIVNGLVLKRMLEDQNLRVYLCSALPVSGMVDAFNAETCSKALDNEAIVILTGGTGNPLFTTDTAAVLRAVQLETDIVLKATRVDGVYSSDPEAGGSPEFLASLSFEDVLERRLGIMDFCALELCKEHDIPVRVFNFSKKGNLMRAVSGESIGTFIGKA